VHERKEAIKEAEGGAWGKGYLSFHGCNGKSTILSPTEKKKGERKGVCHVRKKRKGRGSWRESGCKVHFEQTGPGTVPAHWAAITREATPNCPQDIMKSKKKDNGE